MSTRGTVRDQSDPFATGLYFSKIHRKGSRLHGWGVFAVEDINKNKRILHYAGEKIRSHESAVRERTYLARGEIWCFLNNSNCFVKFVYDLYNILLCFTLLY